MIAAEGLAAVGAMIARYRGGGRFTSDYEVARLTVALRDLRVRDDAWARMDPAHADAHLPLWIDVTRRAQPGHVAAPAALLALTSSRQHQVMARGDIYHRSTRLRCSPSAMTQARSGAVRSAAGQCRRSVAVSAVTSAGEPVPAAKTAASTRSTEGPGRLGAGCRMSATGP